MSQNKCTLQVSVVRNFVVAMRTVTNAPSLSFCIFPVSLPNIPLLNVLLVGDNKSHYWYVFKCRYYLPWKKAIYLLQGT